MSEVEAIGDAMTGGVVARAVEPHRGGARVGADGHARESACLNCGAALAGDYCHRCGQHGHVHRTLSAFGHDLLHGVLHFEGKIWRTLPMLVWRPGELTRRYVAGERARFVSPLALFLFCVFLTFAVFSWTGGPIVVADGKTGEDLQTSLDRGAANLETSIAELEGRRVRRIAAGESTVSLDAKLKEERDELSMVRLMKERGVTEATMIRASDDLPNAPGWVEAAYKKAKANPSLLIYKLQNNAYKYGWALIPISLPFMWLLFPFSAKFRMYDHAVFVTYSLCFMTLLLVALSLVRILGGTGTKIVPLALTFIPPIHMYRQLRGAYRLRWWSALLRTALLLVFCIIASTLFGLMLVALGVLG